MASPEGLEPPTSDLEGRCSIQLSYGLVERRTGSAQHRFEQAHSHKAALILARFRFRPDKRTSASPFDRHATNVVHGRRAPPMNEPIMGHWHARTQ